MHGRILKSIGGFFYVHDGENIYACRARGILKKLGVKPIAGDEAGFTVTDMKDMEGTIENIFERKNFLVRPPVANIDQVLLVIALKHPDPGTYYIDKFLMETERKAIRTVLFFNKEDLAEPETVSEFTDIYRSAGYEVFSGSALFARTKDELMKILDGSVTVLAGPSGAGKSTLCNLLSASSRMEVGELSQKTGRGRQTTRHTELIPLDENTFIVDSPGFASLTTDSPPKDELALYFHEFLPYICECRFSDCSHIYENISDCAVKRAVSAGAIPSSRYMSYERLLREFEERS